jgi:hypothetical protein
MRVRIVEIDRFIIFNCVIDYLQELRVIWIFLYCFCYSTIASIEILYVLLLLYLFFVIITSIFYMSNLIFKLLLSLKLVFLTGCQID